jgi:thiol-disulfide isomerase/thioredoxin
MNRRFLSRVTAAAALCALAATASSATRSAPPIALHLDNGTTATLASYRGQVVLVDFWASWCVPCKTSFPALDALYKQYRDRGLVVIAVNVDERPSDAEAFLAARPHTMPIALDQKGDAAKAFDVQGMPSSFLIDRTGQIRFVHSGYTAKTLDTYHAEIARLLAEHQP